MLRKKNKSAVAVIFTIVFCAASMLQISELPGMDRTVYASTETQLLVEEDDRTIADWVDEIRAVIMNLISIFISIFSVVFFCFIVFYIIKKWLGFRRLSGKFTYVEERKSLLVSKKERVLFKNSVGQIIKRKRRPLQFLFKSKETDQHWIRYIYARWLTRQVKKGFDFRSEYTPIEILDHLTTSLDNRERAETEDNKVLTEIYNDVRYGGKEPNKEEMQELRSRFKK